MDQAIEDRLAADPCGGEVNDRGWRDVGGTRWALVATLVRPVLVYMIVISAMTATACGTVNPLAAAGALLFLASDGLFAWYHFVGPLRWGRPANIVLYQCGQGLIAASLALVST